MRRRKSKGMPRELLTLSDATINDIEVGDICWVNYPYEEDSQKDINGDSTWGKPRPALVINKNINEERPLFVIKGTTSTNNTYNPSDVIKYVNNNRFNCNSIAMLKPHHFLGLIEHIEFYDSRFQDIIQTSYHIHKQNKLIFSTYEDYNMNNNNKNYIDILNEQNSKNIMKSNCRWDEVYAIYNTLPPHEKLFLGNRFIDSLNTVFRWVVTFNGENAGFIELYDMKRIASHKGELIVSTAICPQYRGMRLLEEMQKEAEKFVSESGIYDKLIWLAKDSNKRSIKCAERLGYNKMYHEMDHWVYEMVINKKPLHEDDELMIKALNKKLNKADYGIVVNGKPYTGNNIDYNKYRTLSPKDFEKYFTGTCWDYTEYEAKQFEEVFGFKHTLNDLKEKEYSMYYMVLKDKDGDTPCHTWLAYKLHGKIYLFESSWKKYMGITEFSSEEDMIHNYIFKHKKAYSEGEVVISKYPRNTKFGLTVEQFMRRCINKGKVIYSEIPSISVDES